MTLWQKQPDRWEKQPERWAPVDRDRVVNARTGEEYEVHAVSSMWLRGGMAMTWTPDGWKFVEVPPAEGGAT